LDGKDYIVNLTDTEHIKTVTSCDQVMKQPFKIAKYRGSDAPIKPGLPGAEFTVMLERYVQKYGWDQAVRIAQDENDDRILASEWDVLTTDKFGMAESKKLPYGRYRVKETKIPGKPGELEAAPDFFVTVNENSDEPINWYYIEDPEFTTIVAIEKEDAETHNTVRIPNAEFKIKCLNDNSLFQEGDIVGWLQWSPVPHYVNTFKTNEDGIVMLPEELPVGMYEIIEIKSPYGYLLGPSKPFEITANSFHQQVGPDDHTIVTTVVFEDTSVKGKVKVQKEAMLFKEYVSTQTEYGELFTPVYERGLLPGVKFEIRAETDIVGADETTWYTAGQRVAVLTTDGKTITTSGELPLGTEGHNVYSIREIETAEGYVLDDTIHYFRFDYVDGNTAIVDPTWLDENGEVIEKAEVLTLDNKHQTSIALAKKVMEQSDLKDKAEAYKKVVFGIFSDQVE
ncbi:hypothetical protein D5266_09735, partial [bacterium c-19]|nr:hypothetical protein [bacterium c-19]